MTIYIKEKKYKQKTGKKKKTKTKWLNKMALQLYSVKTPQKKSTNQ